MSHDRDPGPALVRTYVELRPAECAWYFVEQFSDGTFVSVKLSPNQYASHNITPSTQRDYTANWKAEDRERCGCAIWGAQWAASCVSQPAPGPGTGIPPATQPPLPGGSCPTGTVNLGGKCVSSSWVVGGVLIGIVGVLYLTGEG